MPITYKCDKCAVVDDRGKQFMLPKEFSDKVFVLCFDHWNELRTSVLAYLADEDV